MPRRTGATLIEVLVAIFVMGIGLMALLTLFPLGAIKMAKAIQDDRCTQAAVSGAAIADMPIRTGLGNSHTMRDDPSVKNAMENGTPGFGLNPALPEYPSYPVFVDPLGYRTAAPVPGFNFVKHPILPRVEPNFIAFPAFGTSKQMSYRFFTLLDDLVFEVLEPTGVVGFPKQLVPGSVERDSRYSWAYIMQRPRTADAAVVDLSVVVYKDRSLGLTGGLTLPEHLYDGYYAAGNIPEVEYDPTSNVIKVRYEYPPGPWSHVAPLVRAGDWVLDLSTVRDRIHAHFYRVAGVDDNGVEMRIEVQQPLRDFPPGLIFTGQKSLQFPNDHARMIVLEGVAEVFERGLGKTP